MAKRFSQDSQYLSITTPLGPDALALRTIVGEERLSSLFTYRVTMISSDDDIAFDRIVGKPVTVAITLGDQETVRYINAIVGRIELTHVDDRSQVAHYEAELHPWLWMLTHSGDCRIFQEKTVPEIVEAVCKGAGYTDIRKSLTGSYSPREYCVQYRETDYNFVARLLEEEGIFYYFAHEDGKHTLVLGDSGSAFAKSPLLDAFEYRATEGHDDEDNVLSGLSVERRVTPKSYGIDGYHFETPSTDLYATAEGASGFGTVSDYPGRHTTSSDGESLAKLRQQALAFPGRRVRGSGECRSLEAGTRITVSGHRKSDLNAEYVLHSVRIDGASGHFDAHFTAFPPDLPFRPLDTAVKPRIHSTQTAIVVGKSGEEIWLDKYGRIKVQFHWDRLGKKDEKSSCWVRVAQNWAGKNYGIMFFPRVGQEVVVTFLDGDPDRPLVTGSVYNAEQTVPYTLPGDSTRSTIKTQTSKDGAGKFNEIRFEDKADAEEIFVHAQKDMNVEVLNDLTRLVKHDEVETVENDSTIDVQHDRKLTVKNDRSITVSEGNETHDVAKGTRAVTVKGNETHTNKADFTHKADGDYTLTVKGNLTIDVTGDVIIKGKSVKVTANSGEVGIKSGADTKIDAGGALNAKSGMAMEIKSGMGMDIKAGMGMNLKASMALSAEGLSTAIKAQGMGEVSANGILTVKGTLVKVN
ncbi:type VI secretion system Vgr family protein [Azospirillum isscasi]|uniref:Type VI secretion system tip protein TssI/VgrG n=1 Tax=Azospirillum isscasi TaxID=3053926 RepID=A0ABU0WLY0_9PROT|nr:type VI secretion system tip protein VgrG [Azospirillum isscasi]MDQ2105228.1 type VI secretion system tip protein TssI/VgrG [Azospirillum isscasi]